MSSTAIPRVREILPRRALIIPFQHSSMPTFTKGDRVKFG